jgi:transcriptional regulator with XRE-family HTH domain
MKHYLQSPMDTAANIGKRAQELRLSLRRTQSELAADAGVSRTTVHRFEHGNDVGFHAVLRIAFALRAEQGFDAFFPPRDSRTLDDILRANQPRLRARKKL